MCTHYLQLTKSTFLCSPFADPNQQQYYGGGQPGYPPPQQGGGYPPPPMGAGGYPMPQAGGFPPPMGGQPGYPPMGFGGPQPGFMPHMPPPQINIHGGGEGNYGGYDPEDPEVKGFDFTDESIRKGFIRKVYSILCVSIVAIARDFPFFRLLTEHVLSPRRPNYSSRSASCVCSRSTRARDCGRANTRNCCGSRWASCSSP